MSIKDLIKSRLKLLDRETAAEIRAWLDASLEENLFFVAKYGAWEEIKWFACSLVGLLKSVGKLIMWALFLAALCITLVLARLFAWTREKWTKLTAWVRARERGGDNG
ncbi:MAG: hypothetical protein FWH15_06325 [Betaproteobacteria bacterium]|nr:hypothetical protein [Betaproteobacteria bacterium]